MANQLRSPTSIGHLSLSDNSTDDYLYINGVPITGGGGVQLYQHTITTDLGITFVVRSDVSTSFSDFNDVFTYAVGPVRNEWGQTYIAINNEICGCYEYDGETGDVNFVSDAMPTITNDVVE